MCYICILNTFLGTCVRGKKKLGVAVSCMRYPLQSKLTTRTLHFFYVNYLQLLVGTVLAFVVQPAHTDCEQDNMDLLGLFSCSHQQTFPAASFFNRQVFIITECPSNAYGTSQKKIKKKQQ